jgi:predicted kinase
MNQELTMLLHQLAELEGFNADVGAVSNPAGTGGEGTIPPENWKTPQPNTPYKKIKPAITPDTNIPVPRGKPWKDDTAGLPDSTFSQHFDKDGIPKEYRLAVHSRIRSQFLDPVHGVRDSKRPLALVFIGAPGSGKSLLAHHVPQDIAVRVSPESIRQVIPEYREALEKAVRRAAMIVDDESKWLAHMILNEALGTRKGVAIDGTGIRAASYERLVNELHDRGYFVRVICCHAKPEVAWERLDRRGAKLGCWITPNIVRDAYVRIPRTFLSLRTVTDAFVFYNGLQQPPKLAWKKDPDGETIAQRQFVTDFVNQHTDWAMALKTVFATPKTEQIPSNTSPRPAPVPGPDLKHADLRPKRRPRPVGANLEEIDQAMLSGAKEEVERLDLLPDIFKEGEGIVLPDPEWI